MSTLEDREWDAERDARTACAECAAQGIGSSLADCPGHEPETLPDPDELDPSKARLYARACVLVASTIRDQLPHATATRVAEDLEQRAGSYADRADQARS